MLAEGSGERKAAPAPAAAAPGGPRPLGFSMASTELGGHPAIGLSPASPPAGPAFGPGAAAGARARCWRVQPRADSRPSGKGSQGLMSFSYLLEGWFGLKGRQRRRSREVVAASPFLFRTSRAPARQEPPGGAGCSAPTNSSGLRGRPPSGVSSQRPRSLQGCCCRDQAVGLRRCLKAATMRAALAKELAWLWCEAPFLSPALLGHPKFLCT